MCVCMCVWDTSGDRRLRVSGFHPLSLSLFSIDSTTTLDDRSPLLFFFFQFSPLLSFPRGG